MPAKRWEVREDIVRRIESVRRQLKSAPKRLSLGEMAAMAALSEYHFHRVFCATYGETPHAFVTEMCLLRARELLGSTGASASEVSVALGYGSPSSFAAAFKRRFGHPPSVARAMAQDSKI